MDFKKTVKSNAREILLLTALAVIAAIAFLPIFGGKLWGTRLAPKVDNLKIYDAAVAKNPKDLNSVYLRGLQRCNYGKYEGAIDDMTQCLQVNPHRLDALAIRCKAEYKIKRYVEALNDINTVLYYEKQDQDYWLMRADVYEALGRKDLADKDAEYSKKFAEKPGWH